MMQDDTLPFGDEELTVGQSRNALTHPYVTLFHLAFKGAAIVSYLLCGWFSDSFITSFVVIVIFLSMDFWTVKNITGRLMVGLRWWNYVDDDGKSHWVYESRKGQQNRINERESRIFWVTLVLTPVVWSIFFLVALFGLKVKWMVIVLIALSLNSANLHGYIRCKVGNQQSLGAVTQEFFKKQVLQGAVNIVTRQAASAATPQANSMSQPTHTV